jgi:hypothetical protein
MIQKLHCVIVCACWIFKLLFLFLCGISATNTVPYIHTYAPLLIHSTLSSIGASVVEFGILQKCTTVHFLFSETLLHNQVKIEK